MFDGHGDDLYRYGYKIKYNFSTNIVSGVDHTALFNHLSGQLPKIASYPEPMPISLEKRIALKWGIKPDNVAVTNGAADAIYRLAEIKRGAASAISVPAFREYQDAAVRYGHRITFLREISEDRVENHDVVWLCSPENPTGKIYDKSKLLRLAKKFPAILWIIDQAYSAYTLEPVISPAEAIAAGNIVLLSSLTKRYSVPGLRIGYVVGDTRLISDVKMAGIPWAVNSLAIEAGHFLLDHDELYLIDALTLNMEAGRIGRNFQKLGIDVDPTVCNFILCRLPEGYSAACLKDFLIDKYGILIRDASNFETLNERYFRIAAQDKRSNNLLMAAVADFMKGEFKFKKYV